MEYAIVDIETTGGSAAYNRIVEIAIVVHDGEKVIERYQTLVNPETSIPPYVSLIHGITDDMVRDAPRFHEVAREIFLMTENRVFVAHSVNFDFSFIRQEFKNLGGTFTRKKLCTVRLSRQLIPGHKSYSLGNICGELGIPITGRHRAMGDAEATAELFTLLCAADPDKVVFRKFLNQRSKEPTLPPYLDRESFDRLPMETGIYYFHDSRGKVIYIGKAKNIKDRVGQHFSGNTHTKSRQNFHNSIYDVSYEVTGNEFLALLVENEAIKKHYPRYNKSNKSFNLNFGIYRYEDRNGYIRLTAGKSGKRDNPLTTFKTQSAALTELIKLTVDNGLCLKLNGIIMEKGLKCGYASEEGTACEVCHGKTTAKAYNKKMEGVIKKLVNDKSFIIKTGGRKPDESGFVLVEKGRFLGYGYVPGEEQVTSVEGLKEYLVTCYDTQDSQQIIHSFISKARLVVASPVPVYV